MADIIKLKRGSTTSVNAHVPAEGEPIFDKEKKVLKIGDGTNPGAALKGVALSDYPTYFSGEPGASTDFYGTFPIFYIDSKLPPQKIRNLKIEPYTVINLLGKYGDFENGLDTWWSFNNVSITTVTDKVFGNYAIKFYKDNSGGSSTTWPFIYTPTISQAVADHKYFLSGYFKCSDTATNTNKPYFKIHFSDGTTDTCTLPDRYTSWKRHNMLVAPPSGKQITHFEIVSAVAAGTIEEFLIDGVMLVDLTTMGTLPYGLQQYFAPSGITKWEDLATTSNIEAIDGREQSGKDWLAELLPFVNGIATLGFAWEGI